jgi:hypothetical protein
MTILPEAGMYLINVYQDLMYFAGQKAGVIAPGMPFEDFLNTPIDVKRACRNAIYLPDPVFEQFLEQDGLHPDQRDLVQSWVGKATFGRFVVFTHLEDRSIWVRTTDDDNVWYAVHGLTQPIHRIIDAEALPVLIETAILPFGGVIVYDGLLAGGNQVGDMVRAALGQDFNTMREAGTLIQTL